jgi:hypothetical protein
MSDVGKYKRALEYHEERLMRLPNVVGLGITEDPERSKKGRQALAVGVYVSRRVPRGELGPGEVIPKRLTLGKGTSRWVHTRVIESGPFKAEDQEHDTGEKVEKGEAFDEEEIGQEFSKEGL